MTTVSRRTALTPRQLTRTGERLSFIYLEHCTVHQDANAITAEDADGTTHIPSATIGTLLLGPGTRITHQAMSVLGETGAAVCWVGEQGVRYYAGGRALTRSSALAEAQAAQWANIRSRLAVARAVYRLRFPDEDPASLTRQELLVVKAYASRTATGPSPPAPASPGAAAATPLATSPAATRSIGGHRCRACTASPTQSSSLGCGPDVPGLGSSGGRTALWRCSPRPRGWSQRPAGHR
ncbi:hypothetical protein GCM10014715_79640 [Streptomyces spiralis]|uniref:Uncharacterized protein n=1 Tax=Streptomyces spiralis TaxID=66376 RepID=A0A919ALT4_9ACTN|nr:hypothetical protein GCM10014715_79640 [Streptomyces spiralis]